MTSSASRAAILAGGRTYAAAPSSAASRGMPYTTQLASSWAKVTAPRARIRSSPSAPSRPMPVSRQPAAPAPYSAATDSNSTSTEGRQECRGGSSLSRSDAVADHQVPVRRGQHDPAVPAR